MRWTRPSRGSRSSKTPALPYGVLDRPRQQHGSLELGLRVTRSTGVRLFGQAAGERPHAVGDGTGEAEGAGGRREQVDGIAVPGRRAVATPEVRGERPSRPYDRRRQGCPAHGRCAGCVRTPRMPGQIRAAGLPHELTPEPGLGRQRDLRAAPVRGRSGRVHGDLGSVRGQEPVVPRDGDARVDESENGQRERSVRHEAHGEREAEHMGVRDRERAGPGESALVCVRGEAFGYDDGFREDEPCRRGRGVVPQAAAPDRRGERAAQEGGPQRGRRGQGAGLHVRRPGATGRRPAPLGRSPGPRPGGPARTSFPRRPAGGRPGPGSSCGGLPRG